MLEMDTKPLPTKWELAFIKQDVWRMVQKAIRSGGIVRQPCERCGATTDIAAHHDDYSKPLDVRWLCRKCHAATPIGSYAGVRNRDLPERQPRPKRNKEATQ